MSDIDFASIPNNPQTGLQNYYQYMGPWNTTDKGPPKDIIEAISYKHDYNIGIANNQGSKSEYYRQIADQLMLDDLLDIPKEKRNAKWFIAYNGIKLRKATKINIWT